MTTWNDTTKRLDSFIGIHQTAVKCISWSSNGTRLITGDIVYIKFRRIYKKTIFFNKLILNLLEWLSSCLENRFKRKIDSTTH